MGPAIYWNITSLGSQTQINEAKTKTHVNLKLLSSLQNFPSQNSRVLFFSLCQRSFQSKKVTALKEHVMGRLQLNAPGCTPSFCFHNAGRSISSLFINAGRANHFKGRDLHAHQVEPATESYSSGTWIAAHTVGVGLQSQQGKAVPITVLYLYTAKACLLLSIF